VSAVGTLVINVVLARLLPPAALGHYLTLFTLVFAGAILARLGLDRGLVRLLVEEQASGRAEASSRIGREGIALGTAAAVAGTLLLLVSGGHLSRLLGDWGLLPAVQLSAVWLGLEAVRLIVSEVHRGYGNIRLATATGDAARSAATLLAFLGLSLVATELTLLQVVAVSCAGSLVALVAAAVTAAPHLRRRSWTAAGPRQRRLLSISLPLMAFGFFGNVLYQGDILVVSAVRPAADVALYGSAARFAVALGVPFVVTQAVLGPVIGEMLVQERLGELERRVRAAAAVMMVPTLAGFAVFALFGTDVLGWVFGPFYREAAPLLVILSLGQVVNTATGLCQTVLIYSGHERLVMMATAAAATLLIVGGLLAGAFLGMLWVAVFSSLAVAAEGLWMVVLVRRRVGVWTHVPVLPSALARCFSVDAHRAR